MAIVAPQAMLTIAAWRSVGKNGSSSDESENNDGKARHSCRLLLINKENAFELLNVHRIAII